MVCLNLKVIQQVKISLALIFSYWFPRNGLHTNDTLMANTNSPYSLALLQCFIQMLTNLVLIQQSYDVNTVDIPISQIRKLIQRYVN